MMWMEAVDVDLADTILAQIKLSKLSKLLEMLNLDDFIVRCVEDFQLFQRAILEAVKVLKLVAGDVEELKVWHTIESSFEVAILHSWFDEKCFNPILS